MWLGHLFLQIHRGYSKGPAISAGLPAVSYVILACTLSWMFCCLFFLIMAAYRVEGILAWISVKYGLVYLDVRRRKSCIYIQHLLLEPKY
jgi:hypothetical protein